MAERITPCAATPFKIITQWNLISRRHGTSRRGVGTRARRSSGPSMPRAEGGAGTSRANPARTPRTGPVRTPRANFKDNLHVSARSVLTGRNSLRINLVQHNGTAACIADPYCARALRRSWNLAR